MCSVLLSGYIEPAPARSFPCFQYRYQDPVVSTSSSVQLSGLRLMSRMKLTTAATYRTVHISPSMQSAHSQSVSQMGEISVALNGAAHVPDEGNRDSFRNILSLTRTMKIAKYVSAQRLFRLHFYRDVGIDCLSVCLSLRTGVTAAVV